MSARLATILLLALIAVSGAACGNETPPPLQGEERTQPPNAGEANADFKLEAVLTSYAIEPRHVRVPRPGTVAVTARNEANTVHALAIERQGDDSATEEIPGGGVALLTTELPDEGVYVWYCPIADHRQRGMEGTVTVGDRGGPGGAGGAGDPDDPGDRPGGY